MSETYASIEYRRVIDERARTAKLREARIAKEATVQADRDKSVRRIKHLFEARQTQPDFWDNIDQRGGIDACHPWLGQVNSNAHAPYPHFKRDHETSARRVLCLEVFGRAPPEDRVISTICDDHLCMNIRHMSVGPRLGSKRAWQASNAIPLEEFFREPVPA